MVIPCYNEANTLRVCFQRVIEATFPEGWHRTVTIVDDHSDEETERIAREIADQNEQVRLIRHGTNLGKGAAVRDGFASALESARDEDVLVVQDADLEYDPNDLAPMIDLLEQQGLDAVYGDRFDRGRRASPMGGMHTRVNRFLTHASNAATGLSVSDMECCYKLIRAPMARKIISELEENRFGIEPQITAALARAQAKVGNQLISYEPRGFEDGKKIGIKDGIRAVFVITRESFRRAAR